MLHTYGHEYLPMLLALQDAGRAVVCGFGLFEVSGF